MRTRNAELKVRMTIRVNDEHSTDDNDAVAIGAAIDRWINNQPTINASRVDIGIVKMIVTQTNHQG